MSVPEIAAMTPVQILLAQRVDEIRLANQVVA